MPAEGRDPALGPRRPANQRWEEPVSEAKPFDIPKRLVWDADQRVKANRGAAGVDGVSLAAFETDLKNNLYKVWNRMASGSYQRTPVRVVEIPKATGGTRPLDIPTVSDRVAQTAVTMVLEPLVEPHFHPDSYAYRPGRSALDAVGTARKRCWRTDWVIDLDIKAFFDSMPRDLIERAVAHHTDLAWVKLYVATRTMPSSTAGARRKHSLCWRRSGVVSRSAVWSFIPRRPGSSTARTTTGRVSMNTSRSTSSATPSNRDGRRTGGGDTSSASCRRSAPRPRRRSGRPSATGGWRPPGTTSAWRIWLALRTRWCGAG